MAKGKQAAAAVNKPKGSDTGQREMINILKKMEAHLKALVYYQDDSRGFGAGIKQKLAQPFIGEGKDNALESIIREEIKKVLGE